MSESTCRSCLHVRRWIADDHNLRDNACRVYQITVIFIETVTGASTAGILLPIILFRW